MTGAGTRDVGKEEKDFRADQKKQAFLPDGTDRNISEQETCKTPLGTNKSENIEKLKMKSVSIATSIKSP